MGTRARALESSSSKATVDSSNHPNMMTDGETRARHRLLLQPLAAAVDAQLNSFDVNALGR